MVELEATGSMHETEGARTGIQGLYIIWMSMISLLIVEGPSSMEQMSRGALQSSESECLVPY